jgi:hypothetical protein
VSCSGDGRPEPSSQLRSADDAPANHLTSLLTTTPDIPNLWDEVAAAFGSTSVLPWSERPAITGVELFRLAGVEPDPWQIDVLSDPSPRKALMASRQAGKSTAVAIAALEPALAYRRARVEVGGPGLRQTQDLLEDVRALYDAIVEEHGVDALPARVLNTDKRVMLWSNGSRIRALPDNPAKVRGGPARRIIITEAAFTSLELLQALTPKLATTGGDIIAESSAWATDNWFWKAIEGTDLRPWKTWVVTADMIVALGRFTQQFLDEERASLGERVYNREYMCIAMEATDTLFARSDIAALIGQGNIAPTDLDLSFMCDVEETAA